MIKKATIRSFHYATLKELRSHLKDYPRADSIALSLKALKGKMPFGFIFERWRDNLEIVTPNPLY